MKMSPQILNRACLEVEKVSGCSLPFTLRGVKISRALIEAAMNVLNDSEGKTLPQNCRNDIRSRTPDGLDRRIKEYLNTDLRTANIITDVLAEAGIVENVTIVNPKTGRYVKGTGLLEEWSWKREPERNNPSSSTLVHPSTQGHGRKRKHVQNPSLDNLSRDEYLNIPDVIDFMDWFENHIDTPRMFEHHYLLVKAKREWQCTCIYEAYENYWWPFKMECPVQGKQVSGVGFKDSFEYMNFLAEVFRSFLQKNNVDMVRKSTLAMLAWGGVLNKNQERVAEMKDDICDYFSRAKEILNLSKTRLGNHEGIISNAGFTKLYSLLVDDFIMYDSRVGAALGLMGRLFAEEKGLEYIPSAIEFSFGSGRVSGEQLQRRDRRDPSQGKYRLPRFNGNSKRHLNDNIKASWLLKSVADNTASRFALLPQKNTLDERLTAIQAALFMIGYNVNDD